MSEGAAPVKAVSTGQWWVQVNGHIYGPYAKDELAAFIVEGRVGPSTLVTDRKDGAWVEARRVIGLIPPHAAANEHSATNAANMFVHAEIASGSWNAFMAAMESMGALCELGPGLWLLRTPYSVGVIRNTLSQTLERGDRFVVIDASRDRLAWFNLGPEIDVNIARVWNAPLRAEA